MRRVVHEDDPRERRRTRAIALLASLCLALLAATTWLLVERARAPHAARIALADVLADPGGQARLVSLLAAEASGAWDSHPDPDVARVMMPGVERRLGATTFRANRFGLREREFALPKPAGTTRIVLLGDSYVFGTGSAEEDRFGVLLERRLSELARPSGGSIEVLHVGCVSWDVVAECAYVRRQLGLLQPDLVVHLTTFNDLDDTAGVRGFGALARSSPRHPERTDTVVTYGYPLQFLGGTGINYMISGLDHEGRRRYERARHRIERLARAVEAQGGEYVLLLDWWDTNGIAGAQLARGLRPEQVAFLSKEFSLDERYWVGPDDSHWNPAGMEVVADYVLGLILARGLLADLGLSDSPRAREVFAEIHERGRADADPAREQRSIVAAHPLDGSFESALLPGPEASHVHAGLDREGGASPFVSLVLRSSGEPRVRVLLHGLDRPELERVTVSLSLDGERVGRRLVTPGASTTIEVDVPPHLRERGYLTVRLEADDYAYVGPALRHCVSYRLERVELVE